MPRHRTGDGSVTSSARGNSRLGKLQPRAVSNRPVAELHGNRNQIGGDRGHIVAAVFFSTPMKRSRSHISSQRRWSQPRRHNAAQVLAVAAHSVDAGQEPGGVTIRLRGGRSVTARMGPPLGSPDNSLSSRLAQNEVCGLRAMQCGAVRRYSPGSSGHASSSGRRGRCQRTAAQFGLTC